MDGTGTALGGGDARADGAADPFAWLEDIHGADALDWVRARNTETEAWLQDGPAGPAGGYEALVDSLQEVLEAEDRIPGVVKRGPHYYNFWRDAEHPKGVWRRTEWASYLTDEPEWETLLDVDALAAREGVDWVYAGVQMLRPALREPYERALVKLSPDGGDAVRIREFDVVRRAFVPAEDGGFDFEVAKSRVSWAGPDAVYLASDFGPGSLTRSSYARTVRQVRRGHDVAAAPEVFAVDPGHVLAAVVHDQTPGFERTLAIDMVDFHHSRTHLLRPAADGREEWVRVDVPEDVRVDAHREWLVFAPRTDWWLADGTVVPAGSLAVAGLEAFLAGDPGVTVVFRPDARTALQGYSFTRDYLVLAVLEDVASAVFAADPAAGWSLTRLDTGAEFEAVSVAAVDDEDPERPNDVWVTRSGFLTPTTLLRGVLDPAEPDPAAGDDESARGVEIVALSPVKAAGSHFETAGLRVEQHFATSDDGTRVPYFQVGPARLAADGQNPVLMTGYGGFQTSLTPSYSAAVGRGWLTRRDGAGRTGVYVVANIRGGGEYGPEWHRAALKEKRHRAYEDFAAIARDLIGRGVTSPQRLGATGRSNGGLLMGNMVTGYPELFAAVSCGVPLLDMRRYTRLSAGHSWIAEYGDPDVPEEWDFVRTFSPLHRVDDVPPGTRFPATLIWTATSDDRVGPVQARKMYAKLAERGAEHLRYHEDMEGGHAGAADQRQAARMLAMSYEFLWRHAAAPVLATR
ncbi:prolyl oligopeptidase family serine peptidase [Zhihengliuella alba]|uniref:Prolyl oligopeptidase family serine peptidase n=2 Tax=Zhihengliuella alba TaxID=547018 RepID=A0ABP7DZ02_9MICC